MTRSPALVAVAVVVAACGGSSAAPVTRSPSPPAPGSSAPAPDSGTPSPTLDPCLVGTWDATATSVRLSFEGGVTLTGGTGEVLTIAPSGRFVDDYSRMAPPQVDTPSGHQYRVEIDGNAAGHLASTPGALTGTLERPGAVTVNVFQDGIAALTTHPPATAPETYTCAAGTLSVTSADGGTTSTYRRR